LQARRHPELAVDPGQVRLHGLDGDERTVGDLLVGQTGAEPPLGVGQVTGAGPVGATLGFLTSTGNLASFPYGESDKGPVTESSYIAQEAAKMHLDPAAVLSVISAEGGSGKPGDYGTFRGGRFVPEAVGTPGGEYTSFGPFHEHIGGALPSSVADAMHVLGPTTGAKAIENWANSPAGILQALTSISETGAKGETPRA
jgi:hypothetical protein